ncbi:glycoside hydrolase superfamily [Chytriomyces sp. MP71]|nr:glycoside hydrolase superfamily [Chytriomyces sp. MP71]
MRNLAPPLLLAMASAVHAFIDPTVSALESNLGECAISCVTGTNLEQTGINCFGATRTDPAVVSTFEECVSSNCNRSIKLCQASDAPSLKAAPVATNTSVVTGGVPTLNGQPYPTMNGVPCVFSLNCSQFTLGVWFWNGENTDASWNKAMMRKYPSFQTDYSGPFTDDNYLTLRDPADTAAGIKTPLPLRNVSAWDDATDASAFLTFYADQTTDAGTGLGLVTDDWLHYFGQFLKKTGTDSGRRIFLRWCPEMEGVWMTYGKDPNYASVWRRMYTILKQEFPDVIIVWAPNYNWPNDVGGDMELFPGPEYVDVIGSSLYWKGFGQNGPIEPTFMTSIMNGQYALATQYNKPFVITETSAAWEHDVPSSTDEVTIKKVS